MAPLQLIEPRRCTEEGLGELEGGRNPRLPAGGDGIGDGIGEGEEPAEADAAAGAEGEADWPAPALGE